MKAKLTRKTIFVDTLQHLKEVYPMFRELFQIFVYHIQCALKQCIQDVDNTLGDMSLPVKHTQNTRIAKVKVHVLKE